LKMRQDLSFHDGYADETEVARSSQGLGELKMRQDLSCDDDQ